MTIFRSFVLISFLFSCLPSESLATEPDKASYTIGFILPLTGHGANYGNYIKNGIDLAYSKLPKEVQDSVKLVIEDDGWQVPKSVSAFRKLSSTEDLNAIVVVGSAVGNAVAPLAEKKKLPFISIGASDHKLAKGKKYAFIHWVTPETEGKVLADEINRRGYKNLGIIGVEHEGVIAVVTAAKEALKAQGLDKRIIIEDYYLEKESDFRAYIAKARKKEVDGIITCLFAGGLAAFSKQVREQKLNADLIGIEMFEDSSVIEAAEGALDGQWYVNADVATDDFEKAYRARYNEQPGWASANAYDTLNILVETVREHKGSSDKVVRTLAELKDYTGAAGKYSATGDNRFTLPAAVKVVKGDRFEKLGNS